MSEFESQTIPQNEKPPQSVGKGTIQMIGGSALGVSFSIITILFLPRLLKEDGWGYYSYLLALYSVIAIILDLGGGTLINQFGPQYRVKNPLNLKNLRTTLIGLKLLAVIPVFGIGLFLHWDNKLVFGIIFIAALLYSLACIENSILYSANHMLASSLFSPSSIFLRIIFVTVGFWIFKTNGISIGFLVYSLILYLIFRTWSKTTLPKEKLTSIKFPIEEYKVFGWAAFLGSLAITFYNRFPILIPEKMGASKAELGYLGLAIFTFNALILILQSIVKSVVPLLISLRTIKDHAKLNQAYSLSWRYTNILLFPILGGIIILGKPLIPIILGPSYENGKEEIYRCFLLILPALWFSNWSWFHTFIIFSTGKASRFIIAQVSGAIGFFIFAIPLIKKFGIEGSAMAMSGGAILGYLLCFFLSEKFKGYFLQFIRPLISSVIMVFVLTFLPSETLHQIFIIPIVGALFYILALSVSGGLSKEDWKRVFQVLKKNKKVSIEKEN